MKINYTVDSNNVLTSWARAPFDENAPFIEVEDARSLYVNCDKVIDGKLVIDPEARKLRDQERLIKNQKLSRILELKAYLNATDYKVMKYVEGHLPKTEYKELDKQRQAARNEINKLEAELK